MQNERRASRRMQPARKGHVIFSSRNGQRFFSPIRDLSRGGMCIEFPECQADVPGVNEGVVIDDCPLNLLCLKDLSAEVVWSDGTMFGLRFKDPLHVTDKELAQMLAAK
jgi:hypothetical protein